MNFFIAIPLLLLTFEIPTYSMELKRRNRFTNIIPKKGTFNRDSFDAIMKSNRDTPPTVGKKRSYGEMSVGDQLLRDARTAAEIRTRQIACGKESAKKRGRLTIYAGDEEKRARALLSATDVFKNPELDKFKTHYCITYGQNCLTYQTGKNAETFSSTHKGRRIEGKEFTRIPCKRLRKNRSLFGFDRSNVVYEGLCCKPIPGFKSFSTDPEMVIYAAPAVENQDVEFLNLDLNQEPPVSNAFEISNLLSARDYSHSQWKDDFKTLRVRKKR